MERLLQVRKQEKNCSLRLRDKTKRHKLKHLAGGVIKMQEEFLQDKTTKQKLLYHELEKRLKSVGKAHDVKDKKNIGLKKQLSEEEEQKIIQRTRIAFQKLEEAQRKQTLILEQERELRQKLHNIETMRKTQILLQPKISDPIKDLQPVKVIAPPSKQSVESFSTTHFHLGATFWEGQTNPEFIVEKAHEEEQTDAKEAALDVIERNVQQKEEKENELQERNEKAHLRHVYARNEVILQQEKRNLLQDLENLDIKDRQRRKQLIADIPKKIFQPPHQRQRDEKLRQHELENAFERIHAVTCEDPMEKYYRNNEDVLKDEVANLKVLSRDSERDDGVTQLSLDTNSKESDLSQANKKKLRFLRNRIKKQQQQKQASSHVDACSDIDSASVVQEQLQQHTLDKSKQHESLQSMNIESACESLSAKSHEQQRPFDVICEEESGMGSTVNPPVSSFETTTNNINPLTQQNLTYNHRLLEHQKRVADLQRCHFVNKRINQKLIAEAEHKLTSNKVTVYLPDIMGADSPSTILSESSPAANQKEETKKGRPPLFQVPPVDESLSLINTNAAAAKDTSKTDLIQKPDLDLDVSVSNSGSLMINSPEGTDASLSISRIESRTTTLSLQQYPLTGGSTSPPQSSAQSTLNAEKPISSGDREKKIHAATEPEMLPVASPLIGEGDRVVDNSAPTQTLFMHQMKEEVESTTTDDSLIQAQQQVKLQQQQQQSRTIDTERLQRKREQLRSQYPNLFTTTTIKSPSNTTNESTTSPSVKILDRLKNHRESLKQQRQLLEKRRHERHMESVEDILRRSASLGMNSPVEGRDDVSPTPAFMVDGAPSSTTGVIDFQITQQDSGDSCKDATRKSSRSSTHPEQHLIPTTRRSTVVSFQEPAVVFSSDNDIRTISTSSIVTPLSLGNAAVSSHAHYHENTTVTSRHETATATAPSPKRDTDISTPGEPSVRRKKASPENKKQNELSSPDSKLYVGGVKSIQTSRQKSSSSEHRKPRASQSKSSAEQKGKKDYLLPTVNAMLSELRNLQTQIEEHHQIDNTLSRQQIHLTSPYDGLPDRSRKVPDRSRKEAGEEDDTTIFVFGERTELSESTHSARPWIDDFGSLSTSSSVSSKKKKSDHPTPTKPAFYKDKGESDNSDNVPVLSSANLLNTGVQGGGNNYRVSEHPHVSPIKEVDESVLATTLYSKYNSMGSLQEQYLSSGPSFRGFSSTGSTTSTYNKDGLSLVRHSDADQSTKMCSKINQSTEITATQLSQTDQSAKRTNMRYLQVDQSVERMSSRYLQTNQSAADGRINSKSYYGDLSQTLLGSERFNNRQSSGDEFFDLGGGTKMEKEGVEDDDRANLTTLVLQEDGDNEDKNNRGRHSYGDESPGNDKHKIPSVPNIELVVSVNGTTTRHPSALQPQSQAEQHPSPMLSFASPQQLHHSKESEFQNLEPVRSPLINTNNNNINNTPTVPNRASNEENDAQLHHSKGSEFQNLEPVHSPLNNNKITSNLPARVCNEESDVVVGDDSSSSNTNKSTVTFEELLQNNMSILSQNGMMTMDILPDGILQSKNTTSSKSDGSVDRSSLSNSDRFCASFSSYGSERFRALLEHVRQMPMVHAEEQESLISSFHMNNSYPYDKSSIDNESTSNNKLHHRDTSDVPPPSPTATASEVQILQQPAESYSNPNFDDFDFQNAQNLTNYEARSAQNMTNFETQDSSNPLNYEPQNTAHLTNHNAQNTSILGENESMTMKEQFLNATADETAPSTHHQQRHSFSQNGLDQFTLTQDSGEGFSYHSFMEPAVDDGGLQQHSLTQNVDNISSEGTSYRSLIVPTSATFDNGDLQQHSLTQNGDMITLARFGNGENEETSYRNFMVSTSAAVFDSDLQQHSLSQNGDMILGLIEPSTRRPPEKSFSNSSRTGTEYMVLPQSVPSMGFDNQRRHASGSLTSHEMSETSFKRLPPSALDDKEKEVDLNNINGDNNVIMGNENSDSRFAGARLSDNKYKSKLTDGASFSSSSSIFMKDLNTQNLSGDDVAYNNDNENDSKMHPFYEGGAQQHREQKNVNITTPSPIVFTGGTEPIIIESSGQSTSGGELLESDLISSSLEPMNNSTRNRFVMSYFRDTSPEMLSFTKHSSQYDPDAAESRLEFLSLTQESYMPLPERSRIENQSENHSSQDSASVLSNQFHRSTSRDFYNIPKNQLQNDVELLSTAGTTNHFPDILSRDSVGFNQSQNISTYSLPHDSPSKQRHVPLRSSLSLLSPEDQTSDIPTLSHTKTTSKQHTSSSQKERWLSGAGENTSDIQTLSHTTSAPVNKTNKQVDSASSQQRYFKDSSIKTLSYTTTSGEMQRLQQIKPPVDYSPKITTDNHRKLSERPKTPPEDAWMRPPVSQTPSASSTTLSKERNTLSLLTSDRTLSELANLRLSSSSSPGSLTNQNKSISEILGDLHLSLSPGKNPVNHQDENLNEQDSSSSSFVTKDTLGLISQLLSSKSRHHQPSDTDSSELFTVGRLSLSHIEQSRLLSNMDTQSEFVEKRTELSLLSDLNFSSMSETSLNWSSLMPSKKRQSGVNRVLLSSSQEDDVGGHSVKGAVSLQDAFRESKKNFIERSKHRQKEATEKQTARADGQRQAKQYSAPAKSAKTTQSSGSNSKSITSVPAKKPSATSKSSSTSLSSVAGSSSGEKSDKAKQKESKIETKKRTKRLYERLPEVQQQAAAKERQEASKKNREKAQKFHEKIQMNLKKNQQKRQ